MDLSLSDSGDNVTCFFFVLVKSFQEHCWSANTVLDLTPVSLSAILLVYIALLLPHRFVVTPVQTPSGVSTYNPLLIRDKFTRSYVLARNKSIFTGSMNYHRKKPGFVLN